MMPGGSAAAGVGGRVSAYESFVDGKLSRLSASGIAGQVDLPDSLFGHQAALTRWALKRGRAAIFADTGLGKTRIELAWGQQVARYTQRPVLILCPLAVAAQTAAEGARIGIDVTVCRDGSDVRPGINVTNYDRLHRFDCSIFGGVAPDESSVIKHHDAKTFATLTREFENTPFKLPCTATPAPNDWTELGTHAEFLGVCTRAEMLSEFFTHDGGETSVWRLKGHARQAFWQWVCSWGALIRQPSDLGFDDTAYKLPPLMLHEHHVESEQGFNGMLFALEAQTLSERRDARRASLNERVAECARIVNAESDEPWIVWCDLNAEGDALTKEINGAIQIAGADDSEVKEERLRAFADGKVRVLVSKPSICGWGLNWQHAARMAFVGVTDSYEAYYQAVRRCWRFGQGREVHVHIFASKAEGAVVSNLKRKEREAAQMAESLSSETHDAVMREVVGTVRSTNPYSASSRVSIPSFLRSAA